MTGHALLGVTGPSADITGHHRQTGNLQLSSRCARNHIQVLLIYRRARSMRAAIAGCGRAPGFTIVASRLRAHRSLQVAPEHVSADSRCGRPHRAAYITTAAAVPPAPTQPSPARQSANAEAAKLARAAIRSGSTEVAQSSSTSNEWPGLSAWKASGSDRRRRWSGKTCIEVGVLCLLYLPGRSGPAALQTAKSLQNFAHDTNAPLQIPEDGKDAVGHRVATLGCGSTRH